MNTRTAGILTCCGVMCFFMTSLSMAQEHTIPFRFLGHHLLVGVQIDSAAEDYNFIVDTGGLTMLDKAVADTLGLKQRGPMAKITTLDMSGLVIDNVFCFTTFDFSLFRKLSVPVHGIIGSDLMERFRVTFDFGNATIIFSEDTTSLSATEALRPVAFTNHPVNNAPIVPFIVSGSEMKGMIDTGQPYAFVFPLTMMEEVKRLGMTGAIASRGLMVTWPQTNPELNYLARLADIRFLESMLGKTVILFGDLPPLLSMPLIGTDLLRNYIMIINYPKDEIALVPVMHPVWPDNVYSFGLNVTINAEGTGFVEGVWENSPADRADMHPGQRIRSFNRRKLDQASMIDLIELLEDEHTESIVLEREDGNDTRTVTLKKQWLFER